MPLTIRRATPADAATIVEFNRLPGPGDRGQGPRTRGPGCGRGRRAGRPAQGALFVAEEEGTCSGQLMLTFEWSDWRNGWIWWIQSVYVRPEARRRGVFRRPVPPRVPGRPRRSASDRPAAVRGAGQPDGAADVPPTRHGTGQLSPVREIPALVSPRLDAATEGVQEFFLGPRNLSPWGALNRSSQMRPTRP